MERMLAGIPFACFFRCIVVEDGKRSGNSKQIMFCLS